MAEVQLEVSGPADFAALPSPQPPREAAQAIPKALNKNRNLTFRGPANRAPSQSNDNGSTAKEADGPGRADTERGRRSVRRHLSNDLCGGRPDSTGQYPRLAPSPDTTRRRKSSGGRCASIDCVGTGLPKIDAGKQTSATKPTILKKPVEPEETTDEAESDAQSAIKSASQTHSANRNKHIAMAQPRGRQLDCGTPAFIFITGC
jgi:hypothetical protein